MPEQPLIKIATHDGMFHADEVLAVAILTTIFPHHQVIRTRDNDVLDLMDYVVDVGDIYDHVTRRYDHHMHDYPVDRMDHLFSSAGLIWRHYAKLYLKTIGIPKDFMYKGVILNLIEAVEKNIRTHWIYPIDRQDTGVAQGLTPISEIVRSMRPINPEKSRVRYDALFIETVSMVSLILKRSCFHSADYAITKLKSVHGERSYLHENKIVLSHNPVHNYKIFGPTEAHFVICPAQEDIHTDPHYVIRPIEDTGIKSYKTPFPSEVCGRRKEWIEKHMNLKDIRFIHQVGFTAIAETQDAAIALCEQLLGIE